jgi:hypothetical protein
MKEGVKGSGRPRRSERAYNGSPPQKLRFMLQFSVTFHLDNRHRSCIIVLSKRLAVKHFCNTVDITAAVTHYNPRMNTQTQGCNFRLCFWFHIRLLPSSSLASRRLYGRSGFDPRRGQRIFPLTSVSRPALEPTQPPVQWVPGVLAPGVKARPGRDADHSPPLVPRSRMIRSYTSSPPKRLHGV